MLLCIPLYSMTLCILVFCQELVWHSKFTSLVITCNKACKLHVCKLEIAYNYCKFCSWWKSFAVVKLKCLSLEKSCGYVNGSLAWPTNYFYWKTYMVADQSTKTVRFFHLKWFAIYGNPRLACSNPIWAILQFVCHMEALAKSLNITHE